MYCYYCKLYQYNVFHLQYLREEKNTDTVDPGNCGLLGMKQVHFLTGSLGVTNGTEVKGGGQKEGSSFKCKFDSSKLVGNILYLATSPFTKSKSFTNPSPFKLPFSERII